MSSLHSQIFSQSKSILLVTHGVAAVYRFNGTDTDVTIIKGEAGERPVTREGGVTQMMETLSIELSKSTDDGGLVDISRDGVFVIDGDTWGINLFPQGAPGMHAVELVRELRTQAAGRRYQG